MPKTMPTPEDSQLHTATFALEGSPRYEDGDDIVYPNALIFEAGDYPDKKLSVTEEELAQIVSEYTPLFGDLEHILDREKDPGNLKALENKLGRMPRVWVDPDDPRKMRGEIRVPRWFNDDLQGNGVSVVIPLDGGPKRLSRYTLTTKPHVSAAALFADYAAFAGSRHSSSDLKEIQQIHDLSANQGAACKPPPSRASMSTPTEATEQKKEKPRMSLSERLAAVFSRPEIKAELDSYASDGGDETTPAPPTPTPPTPAPSPTPPSPTPRELALMSELEQFKTAQAEADKKAREERVKGEVEALIKSGKVAPASEEYVTFSLLSALEDDTANAKVALFSDKKERNRHDALLALFEAQPAVVPLGEHATGKVLYSINDETDKPQTEAEKQARLDELRAATPLGQAALALRNGNHKET